MLFRLLDTHTSIYVDSSVHRSTEIYFSFTVIWHLIRLVITPKHSLTHRKLKLTVEQYNYGVSWL